MVLTAVLFSRREWVIVRPLIELIEEEKPQYILQVALLYVVIL